MSDTSTDTSPDATPAAPPIDTTPAAAPPVPALVRKRLRDYIADEAKQKTDPHIVMGGLLRAAVDTDDHVRAAQIAAELLPFARPRLSASVNQLELFPDPGNGNGAAPIERDSSGRPVIRFRWAADDTIDAPTAIEGAGQRMPPPGAPEAARQAGSGSIDDRTSDDKRPR